MNKQTEYVEKLSSEMVKWGVQIDRLKEKAESALPQARFEYSGTIAALQLKLDDAAVKLQGISTASDHEWKELKSGTEHIWGEISFLISNAIKKV